MVVLGDVYCFCLDSRDTTPDHGPSSALCGPESECLVLKVALGIVTKNRVLSGCHAPAFWKQLVLSPGQMHPSHLVKCSSHVQYCSDMKMYGLLEVQSSAVAK